MDVDAVARWMCCSTEFYIIPIMSVFTLSSLELTSCMETTLEIKDDGNIFTMNSEIKENSICGVMLVWNSANNKRRRFPHLTE